MGSRLMQSISGSSYWKEADFLSEEVPKVIGDHLNAHMNEIRIDERTANIKVRTNILFTV